MKIKRNIVTEAEKEPYRYLVDPDYQLSSHPKIFKTLSPGKPCKGSKQVLSFENMNTGSDLPFKGKSTTNAVFSQQWRRL
jgi:hypothetical protein